MADTTTEGLNPQFMTPLEAMIQASGGRIWINSGYRSEERQAQLYQGAVAKYGAANAGKYVAPPGHSNHNFGLAADLGGDLELAHQLAPQFGLVFPMSWEPWHIEPPWARTQRGTDYKNSQTTPPVGTVVDDTGYGSLQHQLLVFQGLIKGEDVSHLNYQTGTVPGATGAAPGESAPSQGAAGAVDPHALYQALKAQGLDPVHAAALVAIAGRESSYVPTAHNGNAGTGDDSWGLFQINKLGGQHSQWTSQQLSTLEGSAQAAADLVKSGGLTPWGPYKGVSWATGTNLDAAAAATGGEVTPEQLRAIENEGLK